MNKFVIGEGRWLAAQLESPARPGEKIVVEGKKVTVARELAPPTARRGQIVALREQLTRAQLPKRPVGRPNVLGDRQLVNVGMPPALRRAASGAAGKAGQTLSAWMRDAAVAALDTVLPAQEKSSDPKGGSVATIALPSALLTRARAAARKQGVHLAAWWRGAIRLASQGGR